MQTHRLLELTNPCAQRAGRPQQMFLVLQEQSIKSYRTPCKPVQHHLSMGGARRAAVGTFIQYIRKSSALKSSQFSSSAEDWWLWLLCTKLNQMSCATRHPWVGLGQDCTACKPTHRLFSLKPPKHMSTARQ